MARQGSHHQHHSFVTVRNIIRAACTLMCHEHKRDIGDVSQVVRVCQLFNVALKAWASHHLAIKTSARSESPSHKPYSPPPHQAAGHTLTQRQGISLLSALYLLSDPTQSIQANLQPTNHEINSINFLPMRFKKIESTRSKVMQLFFKN